MRSPVASAPTRGLVAVLAVTAAVLASGLAGSPASAGDHGGRTAGGRRSGTIVAVGAENQYANVIAQIGGRYVSVSAIESNPSTDPHSFEASPQVARLVESAQLVVQNGLGYDAYMAKIEGASPSRRRKVVVVQRLLGLADSTPDPHLWYRPTTMPAVAKAVAADLAALRPERASYFARNVRAFDASLEPWYRAIAKLRSGFAGARVATTEPVGDYLLQAAGMDNLTPWVLQSDIMNGVDPAPQAVTVQDRLLAQHKVRVFVVNQQVTDSVTSSFLAVAKKSRVPVVGVYETMPTPGYDYQSWMLAETQALERALVHKTSTERL